MNAGDVDFMSDWIKSRGMASLSLIPYHSVSKQ